MVDESLAIDQTRRWVSDVVVGDNFCPFARREVVSNRVRYIIVDTGSIEELMLSVLQECHILDENEEVETTLLILPEGLENFEDYLSLLELAEGQLEASGYEGTYQLASFHPEYCFDGAEDDDPANYTNRSPYPTLHLIREASIEKVLQGVQNPDDIPERNALYARQLGLEAMRRKLSMILKGDDVDG